MVRVTHVRVLRGFMVELRFTDGSVKALDLDSLMVGPIFEALRTDPRLFEQVHVDAECGTIVWPNGADLCPDVLYHDRKPAGLQSSQSVA